MIDFDFDFAFYLTLATLISGIIWLLDIVWLSRYRKPAVDGDEVGKEPWYVEYSKSFFPILLFVLILRSFVVEPFRIPSGSMLPTLEVGDFILVNKYCYGLRLPVGNAKFISTGEPKRGDVVVFRYPEDPTLDYIKRVVGVPGDHIVYQNKQLMLNGEIVALEYEEPYVKADAHGGNGAVMVFNESLPGQSHQILINQLSGTLDFEKTVPAGHYFVMGDNRDDSRDSRYWGFMPEENLVGRAFFIWMNLGLDFGRIGKTIR
ncbi:MAG: signal peptidase I [Gammaproteobacteria bacterium]|nr:signal peptidase I [Gammaproteobacteria bacterium]